MTPKQAKQLRPGDKVHWEDPDDGVCSRTMTLTSIDIFGDVVQLTDTEGDFLECYVEELSQALGAIRKQ